MLPPPLLSPALPVVVIGAGPVGLAAAAQLATRGLPFMVLEAGDRVATNVRDWGHVRVFSPWRYNTDATASALLEAEGWTPPEMADLPTGQELIDQYLGPLAAHPAIAPRLRFGTRVAAITRQGLDKTRTAGRETAPFELWLNDRPGPFLAGAVIDASGTWQQPNPLGANGLPAVGEIAAGERTTHGIPDVLGHAKGRFAGRRVLVVGAGHSAANALLALAELAETEPGTRITWAIRGKTTAALFGGGGADQLEARGALGAALLRLLGAGHVALVQGLRITALEQETSGIIVTGLVAGDERRIGPFDEIIACTGQRPDLAMTRELRLELDPWLESSRALGPLIDPNLHSCGTVPPHGVAELAHPEPHFYTIGMKSYGRAPTFLMATGYEQARSVVAALAGDDVAARDVRLVLPETGVCGVGGAASGASPEVCCGGPAPVAESGCCVRDVAAKQAGVAGCGCRAA